MGFFKKKKPAAGDAKSNTKTAASGGVKSKASVKKKKGASAKPSKASKPAHKSRMDGLKLKKWKGIGGIFDYFRKKRLREEEFEAIVVLKKKIQGLPVRLPWAKPKIALREIRIQELEKKKDPTAGKAGKLMRIKFPERHHASTIGPGYPARGLIYANLEIARGTEEREVIERTPSGNPLRFKPLKTKIPGPIKENVFKEYCNRIGIHLYEGEPNQEEQSSSGGLDLTLFDLYWEDIRIERDVLIRELRFMPMKTKVELPYLSLFEKSMFHLSRSCYFSPGYTHRRCEDIIHIFLWLLNRRNLPLVFHIKVMQCLSLCIYSSPVFKLELAKCGGVNILVRIMQLGMVFCGLQASWAAYCLAMAAIGSPEVVTAIKMQKDIDERVGEMTFHTFWYHWPTNFGMILQSILYGPGGVANSLDMFEFL